MRDAIRPDGQRPPGVIPAATPRWTPQGGAPWDALSVDETAPVQTGDGIAMSRGGQRAGAMAPPMTDLPVTLGCDAPGLNRSARAMFDRLAPELRAHFAAVWACAAGADARLDLEALLQSGVLIQRTADGQATLLEGLSALAQQRLAGPPTGISETTYRQELLEGLLAQLRFPRTITQGRYGTCGATLQQLDFATTAPADYARFVAGLASVEGHGRLPNGQLVEREPTSLARRADDQRPRVSVLVQAALMAWQPLLPLTAYHNTDDRHGYDLPTGRTTSVGGMTAHACAAIANAIHRRPVGALVTVDSSWYEGGPMPAVPTDELQDLVQRELPDQAQHGGRPMVPVCLDWGTTGHWVGLTAITADRVYFTNPHGNCFADYLRDERGQLRSLQQDARGRYIEAPYQDGPACVRIYEDGTQSLSLLDFSARLNGAVVGQALVEENRRRVIQGYDSIPL